MEAAGSSETTVSCYITAQRHNPEDRDLNLHLHKHLKFLITPCEVQFLILSDERTLHHRGTGTVWICFGLLVTNYQQTVTNTFHFSVSLI
jgi:hypothetical protein